MSDADEKRSSSRSVARSRASRDSSRETSDESAPGSERAPGSSPGSKGERRTRKRKIRKQPPFMERHGRHVFGGIAGLGLFLAALLVYLLVVYPSGNGPGSGRDVELTIDEGEATSSVGNKLAAGGLLSSPRIFGLYAALVRPRLTPGRHLLTDDAGPAEILRRIERAGTATKAHVTIPEGWTRYDIAKRLHALQVSSSSAFLDATTDPELLRELNVEGDNVEGFLFPATYDLPKDSDARDVVRRLVSEFERRYGYLEQHHRLGRAQLEASLKFTRRDIITLASMIEKEAAVDDERPIIASVFLNRLRDPAFKRKVLQCDATSGYGCLVLKDRIPSCANYTGKITPAMNNDPANPYSTYVHEGLPPGPIGNPGAKSIQAALAPSNTKYLYFVTRGDRRHAFSEALDAHNSAVKDMRERMQKKPE